MQGDLHGVMLELDADVGWWCRRLAVTARYKPRGGEINGEECWSRATIAEQERFLAVVLEPAVQDIRVDAMLQGHGGNRGAGLRAGG